METCVRMKERSTRVKKDRLPYVHVYGKFQFLALQMATPLWPMCRTHGGASTPHRGRWGREVAEVALAFLTFNGCVKCLSRWRAGDTLYATPTTPLVLCGALLECAVDMQCTVPSKVASCGPTSAADLRQTTSIIVLEASICHYSWHVGEVCITVDIVYANVHTLVHRSFTCALQWKYITTPLKYREAIYWFLCTFGQQYQAYPFIDICREEIANNPIMC